MASILVRSVVLVVALCAASAPRAQAVPTGIMIETLISAGIGRPIDFTFLPDGRILIADRAGPLRLYAGGAPVQVGSVPNVDVQGERGLLSVEADPAFAQNGYVYVYYVGVGDPFRRIERFTLVGDRSDPSSTNLALDPASRRLVLPVGTNSTDFHCGGALRFGSDGMLYASLGDDDRRCEAQRLDSGLGCILRIDVSGVPSGGGLTAPTLSQLNPGNNPLSANTDLSQLVVANGLRNPFRFEIDVLTGNLYIGDVGAGAVEEVDEYAVSGAGLVLRNYGWPWFEGTQVHPNSCAGSSPPNLQPPLYSGDHAVGWTCLVQGPRYRNLGRPYDLGPQYEGKVFCFDFYFGWTRVLDDTANWSVMAPVPGQPNPSDWATGLGWTTAMRQGPDGAIYMTRDFSGWWYSELQRIRPQVSQPVLTAAAGSDQHTPAGDPFPLPLVARILGGNNQPVVGVPVTFSLWGSGALSTTAPVVTDGNGEARVQVTAGAAGGAVTVTASSPAAPNAARFELFGRKMAVANTSSLVVVNIQNRSNASSGQVPFVVFLSLPGSPPWASPWGTMCTNPTSPLTIAIEDGLGVFGGGSLSGLGSMGLPGLTRVYQVPPGLLTGLNLQFQAIGLDPVEGFFRTDCAHAQF